MSHQQIGHLVYIPSHLMFTIITTPCPMSSILNDVSCFHAAGKSKSKSAGNYKYHLVNYANQAPAVPSVKLTSLENSSAAAAAAAAMTFTGPMGVALPAYTALANAGNVPCKLHTVRSHKTSTSSVSGSSTVSSDVSAYIFHCLDGVADFMPE